MNDIATPSLSIACLGACKSPAIRLSGQVLSKTVDLHELRVEAWDRTHRIADLLACGFTDAYGVFELVFPAETLRVFFGDQQPTLFFRVFHGPTLLADTETSPGWDLDESTSSRVTIDLPRVSPDQPGATPAPFTVRGHLRNAEGTPLVGLTVRAFDRNLRDRETELLLHATTDAVGGYLIPYAVEELGRSGKHLADLLLRVYDATGGLVGAIDAQCKAPAALVVDLLVDVDAFRGPSEFEALTAPLLPLLPEGVDPADLTDEDIAFLTCSGGLDAEKLAALVAATILARDLDVLPALLYGLAREGLSLALPALVARTPDDRATAFDKALDERIIPTSLGSSRSDLLAGLEAALLRRYAEQPVAPGKHSLDALLATVLTSSADRDQLVALQLAHQGSAEAFWATLEAHPVFGDFAPALAFTATIATITDNHLPLIEALHAARNGGTLQVARDLATLNEAGWTALVDAAGVPADAPGTDPADKVARYTADLQARVEEAFPSAFFAARLVEEERSDELELAGFLRDNPDFDLGTSRLDEYLAGPGAGAVDSIADLAALQLGLAGLQRIFKLTSHYPDGRALLDAGLTSAHDVVRMGRSRFVDQFSERMGSAAKAEQTHARAAHVVAASLTLFGQHHASMNALSLRVLPAATTSSNAGTAVQGMSALGTQAPVLSVDAPAMFSSTGSGRGLRSGIDYPMDLVSSPPAMSIALPTLTNLFGAFSFCACDQCQSVHGAAAYLVELLAFLEPHTSVLFARRPDLGRIELTCDNTNTPLPYIDLVNEVLERRITGAQAPWPQTTRTADELAVSPEHVDAAAYTTLAAGTTVYPWILPFDLGLEQSRVFLTHLGVPRHELLSAFGSAGTDPTAIAAEILGLSPSTWSLVGGTDAHAPKAFWGPAPSGGWASPNWVDSVAPLPEILQRSRLAYTDLTAVLATRFVNPSSTLGIVFDGGSCAIDDGHVTNLDATALGRIHRFARLQQQLGWTPVVLDQALAALSPSGAAPLLSEGILLQLASVQQLSVDLAQPISSLVVFWGAIDTAPGEDAAPSRYQQLFQNPAVLQIAGSSDVFALDPITGDIATPAALTSVLPSLLAALQITAADLSLLTDIAVATSVLHVPSAVVADDALTLANLSQLYRHVVLARALRLSIRDLLTLQILSGLDPFDRQHVEATRSFVRLATKVRASGFKIAELDYLLRDVQPSPGTIGPDPNTIAQLVDAIRSGLQALPLDSSADPVSDAAVASRLPLLKEKLSPSLKLDSDVIGLLLTQLVASPADPTQSSFVALSALVDAEAPTEAAAQTLVRLTKVALLLKRFKLTVGELGFLQGTDDRPWIVKRAPALGWLDLNALPPKQGAAPTPSLLAWERIVDYVTVRSRLPQGTPLLALFHAPTSSLPESELLTMIAERTGVAPADLGVLASTWSLSLASGDYADERVLIRVQAAIELVRRLGVPAAQAITWANASANASARLVAAGEIRRTAKAKYDDATWSTIARPLQNVLRAKQRSALVAYLVGKGDFRDENALFEYILLDTQITPCMMTSRIKQAIGSAQLFIQRALMNLEPAAPLAPEAAKLWTWMKTYRVWEAGRKIFLYPENWILPELRDDKTPFFKELEQDLKKHDVTSEIAEQAFRRYVEKLDEVARLEVVGMYREVENEPSKGIITDVLHVIGRTYASPRVYFYRKQVKLAADVAEAPLWTPWEKIDLDIEGDHLLPIVHEGRLRLLWPLFNQKSFAKPLPVSTMEKIRDALQAAVDSLPPGLKVRTLYQDSIASINQQLASKSNTVQIDYFEIKLAWSEFRSGRWSPRKVAPQAIRSKEIEFGTTPPDASKYVFHVESQDSDLVVRCLLPMMRPTNEELTSNFESVMAAGEIRLSGCAGQDTSLDMAFVDDDILARIYSTRINMTVADDNGLWAETGNLPAQAPLKDLLAKRHFKGLLSTNTPDGHLFALIPHQLPQLDARKAPFFAHDARQTFLVSPVPIPVASNNGLGYGLDYLFRFERFAHPFSCTFLRDLNRAGVDGLLRWGPTPGADPADPAHLLPDHVQWATAQPFAAYNPSGCVAKPWPIDEVDTASDGVYAAYNRELFFHAPFLVADRLSKNQRFEEAQKWFHYIFDPTDGSTLKAPARYWKYRPFYEEAGRMASGSLDELLSLLGGTTPEAKQARATLEHEVSAWRQDPFNPHRIARLRPAAYPKNVVMRYIQNLIDWGDQLFRRDTLETLNEATLLYVLASDILGPRPVILPAHPATPTTYVELLAQLHPLSDYLVNLEGMIPTPVATSTADDSALNALLGLGLSGFCVPPNEQLLGLWDTVADRLFKIRNCMNIEGVVRELPLFEPPIDPALLVRAAAAGLDLGTVLGELNAPTPLYRFQTLLARAAELCGDVRALGAALLSALEKLDAEAVSLLRSSHELQLLDAVRDVKAQQIREAERALAGLQKAREVVEIRYDFYRTAVFTNPSEQQALILSALASELQLMSQTIAAGAGPVYAVPDGFAGTDGPYPLAFAQVAGGVKSASGMQAFGQAMGIYASLLGANASMSATLGGYQRRADDWKREEQALAKELQQMDKQLLGAEIRLAIAENELENHDLQRDNAREADALLHDKFTNEELYDWMVGELSAVHFQSYRLAWDAARRAERAFQFELRDNKASFLQPGAWDSLRKGLLAGEKLQHDLRRMEMAYLDKNTREFELTKHISLAQLDPLALIQLRETGTCGIHLPEALFDHDFPGHYFRRIKTVSITIPCVTGQYTGMNATLTLAASSIRTSKDVAGGYAKKPQDQESRFSELVGSPESIVTSGGQNDSGLFEANLHDERYLPFEGKGAISTWAVEINPAANAFDLATISDVILHLRYTASDGGAQFKTDVTAAVAANSPLTALVLVDPRAQFPDAWYRFLHPRPEQTEAVLTLPLTKDQLPFLPGSDPLVITQVDVLWKWSALAGGMGSLLLTITAPSGSDPGTPVTLSHAAAAPIGGLGHAVTPDPSSSTPTASPGTWTLNVAPADLATWPDMLDGLWLLLTMTRDVL